MGILGFPDLRLFKTETQTIAEANLGDPGPGSEEGAGEPLSQAPD